MTVFQPYLTAWNLRPDGAPIVTAGARLLPVRAGEMPAMLKLSDDPHERGGAALMVHWNGDGAARVLRHADHALLIERATGAGSLSAMARDEKDSGQDDLATRILCATAARLHVPRPDPPPALVPLDRWFRSLWTAAGARDRFFGRSAEVARALLATPRDPVVLHGDLHHDNVPDFGPRGWLAIDPKGLIGERGFDYANIFTNPDLAQAEPPVAVRPDRFLRRLDVVTEAAGLDRRRLLMWIVAWCGLSAAWFAEDGADMSIDLRVADLAAAELDRMGQG